MGTAGVESQEGATEIWRDPDIFRLAGFSTAPSRGVFTRKYYKKMSPESNGDEGDINFASR